MHMHDMSLHVIALKVSPLTLALSPEGRGGDKAGLLSPTGGEGEVNETPLPQMGRGDRKRNSSLPPEERARLTKLLSPRWGEGTEKETPLPQMGERIKVRGRISDQ